MAPCTAVFIPLQLPLKRSWYLAIYRFGSTYLGEVLQLWAFHHLDRERSQHPLNKKWTIEPFPEKVLFYLHHGKVFHRAVCIEKHETLPRGLSRLHQTLNTIPKWNIGNDNMNLTKCKPWQVRKWCSPRSTHHSFDPIPTQGSPEFAKVSQ